MNIITEQLANKLPKDSELQKYKIVNPTNFNELYQQLKSNKTNEINVIDLTSTPKEEYGIIISVQDHINRTGTNILIGKQKFLSIDFLDITIPYISMKNGIITDCCGQALNNKYEYPSHNICHITTLAHAMNIKNIHGFLYNISQQPI